MQGLEVVALAVAVVVIAVSIALEGRRQGEVGSWAWSWALLIAAGLALQLGAEWAPARAAGAFLAVMFPGLQLAGAIEHVGRPVPRWLIPAFGGIAALRLATASAGFEAQSHLAVVGFEISALLAASIVIYRWGTERGRFAMAGLLIAGFCAIAAVEATDSVLDITSAPPGVPWTVWLVIGIPIGGSQLLATFARLRLQLAESHHDREAAQEALEDSDERFRAIAEHANDLIVEADSQRRIQYVNPRLQEVLGYTADEMLGRDLRDFAFEESGFPSRSDLADARELVATTVTVQHRDGSPRWLECSARVHRRKGEPRIVVIARDVTESRRIEEQMRRAQKLDALGVLAGGIAHDFNNLLVGILGNASLLAETLDSKSSEGKLIGQLIDAAERTRGLTDQLLTFARGGAPVREAASISDLIQQTARFSLRGSQVVLQLELQDDLWAAEVDKGQVSQVISNLLINARQATSGSGAVRVSARNAELRTDRGAELPAGRYVQITVEDEGSGIAAENLGGVFDPYFSTKAEGTGLGLATSWSIVRRHGGTIFVESVPGEGARFDVFLPASDAPVPAPAPAPIVALAASRVLVMDDEYDVRAVALEMLSRLGCQGEAARDGAQLLSMYRAALERGEPYDLVIMDLTVPGGMGGDEAIWKLREIDANVRAIASSGYSDSQILAEPEAAGFDNILIKPYGLNDLREALTRTLSRERP